MEIFNDNLFFKAGQTGIFVGQMCTSTVYKNSHLEVQISRTLLFLIKFLQRQMVRKDEHRIHVA